MGRSTLSFSKILKMVDEGEIDILSGVLKVEQDGPQTLLKKQEYLIDFLEEVLVPETARGRKRLVLSGCMKYAIPGKDEIILDNPDVKMGVYLRVLSKDDTGGLTTRDENIGDFKARDVAKRLGSLKYLMSYARGVAYSRLKTLVSRTEISERLRKKEEDAIVFFGANGEPYVFRIDLYNELRNDLKEILPQ